MCVELYVMSRQISGTARHTATGELLRNYT